MENGRAVSIAHPFCIQFLLPRMLNLYSVIAVNPQYNPRANYDLAMSYIAFVTGLEGQKLIADYKFNGEPLFVPDSRQGS